MVSKEFFEALADLEAEKGISQEIFIEALRNALISAYKKQNDCGTGDFADLYASLLKGERPDYYFVLYDLNSYVETLLTINEDYKNRVEFAKKQLNNTSNSAYFSSDRTIKEYARDIWKI